MRFGNVISVNVLIKLEVLQKEQKMDITRTFKATIKAVRMRKKATSEDGADVDVSKDIFKKQTPSVFKQRSKEIVRILYLFT